MYGFIHIVHNTPGKTGPEYRVSHRQVLIQYLGCPYPMKNNVTLTLIVEQAACKAYHSKCNQTPQL